MMMETPTIDNLPLFLKVEEVASFMRCSKDTIYLAIKNKRLKATVMGGRPYRILRTDFEAWVLAGAPNGPLA
jgi:excisionase family DNA binding protein